MERPPTSKARGICRYFQDPRGCWAGSTCKFLHCENPETEQGLSARLTPYDQAKTCRYFANGYCKKADKCWFLHVAPQSQASGPESNTLEEIDPEDELCSICFEKPPLFGLLTGCSHVFCITCIKQWRDPAKSGDVVFSGVHKKCPMCRTPSRFVTPSSLFFKQGDSQKEGIIAAYKESMARVPCRHFVQSKASNGKPFCPFGKDCFYQHLNADGTKHTFTEGAGESVRRASQRARYGHGELNVDSEVLFSDIFATVGESSFRSLFNHVLQDEHLIHLTSTLQAVTDRFRQMEADVARPGDSAEADATQPSMQNVPTIAITDRARPITSWSLDTSPTTIRNLNIGVPSLANIQHRLLRSLDEFVSGFAGSVSEEIEEGHLASPVLEVDGDGFSEIVNGIDDVHANELYGLAGSMQRPEDDDGDTSSNTSMPSLQSIDSSDDDLRADSTFEDEADAGLGRLHSSDSLETFPENESNLHRGSSGGRGTLDDMHPSNAGDSNDTAHSDRPRTVDGNEETVQPPFVTDGRGRVIGASEESSGARDESRWFLSRMFDGSS